MPCKILVAEDEPGIRAIVAQHLKREGFSVRTAADGEEAACLVRAVLGQGLYVWHELDVAHGEHLRVVEQGAVNASFVFAFYVAELIAARGEGRLGNEVGQRLCILHLAHSDGGASYLGQHVGAHLRQHA